MSHGTCPTVKIDDGKGGFAVINEHEFDEAVHTLYGEKPKTKRKVKAK
jgi:hypothetical protein